MWNTIDVSMAVNSVQREQVRSVLMMCWLHLYTHPLKSRTPKPSRQNNLFCDETKYVFIVPATHPNAKSIQNCRICLKLGSQDQVLVLYGLGPVSHETAETTVYLDNKTTLPTGPRVNTARTQIKTCVCSYIIIVIEKI